MHGDPPTTDEPVTWFHGLIAERTAAFALSTQELPFLERAIARFGQPVLDLGCGTGRLLLPLLRDGAWTSTAATSPLTCCDTAARRRQERA